MPRDHRLALLSGGWQRSILVEQLDPSRVAVAVQHRCWALNLNYYSHRCFVRRQSYLHQQAISAVTAERIKSIYTVIANAGGQHWQSGHWI